MWIYFNKMFIPAYKNVYNLVGKPWTLKQEIIWKPLIRNVILCMQLEERESFNKMNSNLKAKASGQ